ncbi:guanylate kinase [Nonomuraea sp. MG754425]|uniref:guanylate kinase n=1 Tax=Nonomuraea sp. MG754425 TaxID=2570319 RepID=UPI001F311F5B|nr:guanylate kinase [Nonomuraea sp. MG754425]MCF6470719.1 guanylate kinase [Nonomuraea sp. MG754425]
MTGIVLYGPPASGKSTITLALAELDPRFTLVRKLKAGNRRGTEYDFVSVEELAERRAAGRLLVESHRYGNTYAIDRDQVDQLTAAGRVPIAHLGDISGIRRLMQSAPWLVVLLWIPRDVCEHRSRERGDRDTVRRLQAWDETLADLDANGDHLFASRLRTDQFTPAEIARQTAHTFFEQQVMPVGHHA